MVPNMTLHSTQLLWEIDEGLQERFTEQFIAVLGCITFLRNTTSYCIQNYRYLDTKE